MDVEAQAANLHRTAILRGVGESSEGEVPYSLDRNAGEDSNNGEQNKGRQVEEDDDAE